MELPVYNLNGSQSKNTVALSDKVFGVKEKDHLIHQAVLSYLAAQRQGTSMARNRSLVSGSNRKPWRQKGTGRARAGTLKSNIWRGGGKAFGPSPHTYSVGMNKKERRIARRAALSNKALSDAIILIENFNLEKPETRFVSNLLQALNIANNSKTLLVIKEYSSDLWQSCRNVKNLSLVPADQLCTYDIVKQARLVIQEVALERINEVF